MTAEETIPTAKRSAFRNWISLSGLVILLGSLFWLAILTVMINFFWRLGNHYLHPATHGFGLRDQLRAIAILERHKDLDLSTRTEADPMYATLPLRDLLLTYQLMDQGGDPERLKALLFSMRQRVPSRSMEN